MTKRSKRIFYQDLQIDTNQKRMHQSSPWGYPLQKHDAAGKESGGGAEPCPSWVKEVPTFTSDQYKIQIGGKDVDVPGSEIIAFNEPDPANPYWRGAGVAEALADAGWSPE